MDCFKNLSDTNQSSSWRFELGKNKLERSLGKIEKKTDGEGFSGSWWIEW